MFLLRGRTSTENDVFVQQLHPLLIFVVQSTRAFSCLGEQPPIRLVTTNIKTIMKTIGSSIKIYIFKNYIYN